jgi:hypothetical protein
MGLLTQPEGTSTRHHTIGVMPSNHTLTCTIAFASAADGAEGPRESGSVSRRFIQPDYRLPYRPSPGTPQILMLPSWLLPNDGDRAKLQGTP